ncbi:MAG: exo-alpha-sialidase [Clostridiaceae bacterium]|nr:exo-alpha-sialidase [Clostridiaceae bacterium]
MAEVGKIVLELPPRENNPRNSEGAFIILRDNSVMFVYSRFTGDKSHDDASANLAVRYSFDKGETWTDEEIIFTRDEYNAKNIMSVSLMRMNNGDIGLYYGIRKDTNDARKYLRRSGDEGKTWSQPIPCIPPVGYYVVNNDRVVKLSDGRIIVPSAFHRNGYSTGRTDPYVRFDNRGVVIFFISDDDGNTWREGNCKCVMPFNNHSNSGLQEPGLIELKNGVLWAWARTDMCFQYEMFSFDRGETWTTAQPSRFTSPCSPLSMKRIPWNGDLVAVWNPVPNYNGRKQRSDKAWHGGRTPLVIAVSKDDGKTWSEYKVVENDPDSGYCYTAIHFLVDSLLLAYCAGGPEDGSCLARLRVRKIMSEELEF